MKPQDLRARARQEIDELGPEPIDPGEHTAWAEERRGAMELLAALAEWNHAVLRRAALEVANEWSDRPASQLLLDASNVSSVDEDSAT
jgi:hypothetical protein